MRRWLGWPLAHPRSVVLLTVVVALAFGWLVAGLRIDNTTNVWLPPDDPDLVRYREFRKVFGDDNFLVVATDDANELRRRLTSRAFVERVVGPLQSKLLIVFPADDPDAFRRIEAEAGDARIAGPAAINHYLDAGSQDSFGRLFPVTVGLIAVVLWFALRDLRIVAGVLLVGGISTLCALAALAAAGRTLNMVVSVIPALLIVLGTAYSLHLLTAFRSTEAGSARERWASALADTFRPCLLTALTTASGLGALAWADIPPVRDLGVFSALGVLASFGLVFFFLPALLLLLGVSGRRAPAATMRPFAAGVRRWRGTILTLAAGATLLAAFGASRLTVESHILGFFRDDHRLVRATATIERDLTGLTPVEIWAREDVSARLWDLAASEPAVTGVLGPDRHGDDWRWTLATRTLAVEKSHALIDRVRAAVDGHAEVTGAVPILVRIQTLLLRTQLRTFAVSFAVVTIFLVGAFRSPWLALLSLVPNLLPVLFTLGLMGALGVPLDVATVTVASIALGLVVDDTIHFLDRYRAARGSVAERLDSVFRTVGRPILATSAATAIGFLAFAAAPFKPTFYFGVLIAATAAWALACDLIVLPALLLVRT